VSRGLRSGRNRVLRIFRRGCRLGRRGGGVVGGRGRVGSDRSRLVCIFRAGWKLDCGEGEVRGGRTNHFGEAAGCDYPSGVYEPV
jgi:hypothetical protein